MTAVNSKDASTQFDNDFVPLYTPSQQGWKGTGTYEVFIIINGGTSIWQKMLAITNSSTTVALSEFCDVTAD